ncbi:MAG: hypothetical protein JW878_05990 [Methanomicrobia archaeon]|nr:hypothetical protein [Methanomicrobia archaeon]
MFKEEEAFESGNEENDDDIQQDNASQSALLACAFLKEPLTGSESVFQLRLLERIPEFACTDEYCCVMTVKMD